MNIDEAKKISKEHDALEVLQKRIFAFRDDPRPVETDPAPFGVEDKDLNYLVPLLERRIKDLAMVFEPAPAPVNPVRDITIVPGRPKVKPAVVERWNELSAADKDFTQASPGAWKEWALKRGFKWSSVQNVLRELAAEREKARLAERQKDPLNAGVTKAAENFASQHDADVQKDTFAKLATRG